MSSLTRSCSIPTPAPGDVWYFAFGSNMNPTVLTGRRKVQPKASVPATLDGYVLGFNMRGVPYVEPGMATIVPFSTSDRGRAQQQLQAAGGPAPVGAGGLPILLTSKAAHQARCAAGLHGVLHLITDKEWETVKLTEGVKIQGIGYQVVKVPCELYNGAGRIEALTLLSSPISMGNPERYLPSKRYLDLIREGARIHGLDPAYIQMLEAHPAFDPPTGLAQSLGRSAMAATALTLALPLMPFVIASAAASSVKDWWQGTPPPPPAAPGATSGTLSTVPTTTTITTTEVTVQAGGEPPSDDSEDPPPPPPPPAPRVAKTAISSVGLTLQQTKAPPGGMLMTWFRTHIDGRIMAMYMFATFRLMELVHDWMLRPVLGSGMDNDAMVRRQLMAQRQKLA